MRAWLMTAKGAAERRGLDADALLRQVGLDLSTVTDPMARYPARSGLAFWQLVNEAAGEELIGLEAALESVPLTLNDLAYALMASENLGQMYARLARYAHVVSDAGQVSFSMGSGAGHLSINGDPSLLGTASSDTVWSIFDYAMLIVVRGSRMIYGREFMPLELHLQRPRPKDHARYEKLFRCVPLYGCEDNVMVVDMATLQRPLSFANLAVVRASEDAMERYRHDWQGQGLTGQIAAVLKELLPSGEPRQVDVAQRLSLTLRSFQRRLADQQTCYRDVLNETRHQLAVAYLGSQQYSVGEVAFLLGFSEVSAFTRAFKRWTGSSPRSWRNQAD